MVVFALNDKFKPVYQGCTAITYLSIFVILGLVSILFGLGMIVFPRSFMPMGREPRVMCEETFLGIGIDKELAKISLILTEIEACQVKIDYNEQQNSNRTLILKWLMIALWLLILGSAVIILGYVL